MVKTRGTGTFTEDVIANQDLVVGGDTTLSGILTVSPDGNAQVFLSDNWRLLQVESTGSLIIVDNLGEPFVYNRLTVASGLPGMLDVTLAQLTLSANGNVFIRPSPAEGLIPVVEEALHVAGSGLFEGGDVFVPDGAVVSPTGTYSTSLTISGQPVSVRELGPRAITIEQPGSGENSTFTFTEQPFAITGLVPSITGLNDPGVTWTLRFDSDRNAAGTEVVVGGTNTHNGNSGQRINAFDNASVPANSFLWFETPVLSGTVNELAVTMLT